MSIEKLCSAIRTGDLPQIQALLKEGVDVNSIEPEFKTRPIDFAAQTGDFDLLKLLCDYGAKLERHPDYPLTNLLFWVSRCQDQKKAQTIVLWLLEGERYKKLGCNLHENHLFATLGALRTDIDEQQLDNLGLSPWHYFISANPFNILESTLKSNSNFANFFKQNKEITEGPFENTNPLIWVPMSKKSALLPTLKELNPGLSIDLNQNIDFCRGSIFINLLRKAQWQDLQLIVKLYPEQIVDLNATDPQLIALPLIRILAECQQWQVIKDLVDRDPTQIIDIGATQIYKNTNMCSIAFKLALYQQWSLLQTLAKRSQSRVDLNEFVKNEKIDTSLAIQLGRHFQWELLQYFVDNDPNQVVNLDSSYSRYNTANKLEKISLALILVSGKQWTLLKNLANRDPNQNIDLNLTTESYGTTLACGLAANKQWEILSIFLRNFDASKEAVNLNVTLKDKKDSLAQLLVKGEQIDLLIKLLGHPQCKIDIEHPFTVELIPLLLNRDKERLVNDIMDRYSETEIALILNHLETIADPEKKQQTSNYLYYYLTTGYEKRTLIMDENPDSETISNCVEAAQGLFNALSKIETKSSYYPRAQFIKAHFLQVLLPYPAICDALLKEVPELFPSLNSSGMHAITSLPGCYQVRAEMLETYYLAGSEGAQVARILQHEMMCELFRLKENQPAQESNKKRKPSDSDEEKNKSDNKSPTFFSADKKERMKGQERTLTPEKKFNPNNNNNNCN